ncbi:MAG: glycoside hydrolase family 66 protein [Bifidobacterium psychraerophilum]|uniref:glycoside hydrolase family 66 protein n=1 Tax=Bifidobacterium psychraerophilum TaxID=218140 RepID=UPI0039EB7C2B
MDIFPSKAQFHEAGDIEFLTEGLDDARLHAEVLCDNREVFSESCQVKNGRVVLAHGAALPPGGYLARFTTESGATLSTAFDLGTATIRYGFLSDFSEDGEYDVAPVDWLNKLHINYVQYYDWMYRHDDLIPPTPVFEDALGRRLSARTVQARMAQASAYGMSNIAYGAIYGAGNDFAERHRQWRLYDLERNAIGFLDFLSIMNVNRVSGWHDHIIAEYGKAIEFGFDGIHMDTYGFPKDAYDYDGAELDLPDDFAQLIDDSKRALTQVKADVKLIFNNVGNWPVESVANRQQEAIYIEVWDPYNTYRSIVEIISHARSCNADKQIILAAYLLPFNERATEEEFNALFILSGVITVMGATHLIHGENRGIITEGYYARYFHNEDEHYASVIRRYYDYITYFSHLWSDPSLTDVSHTHMLGDNREYTFDADFVSPDPEAGKLWMNVRENEEMKFINFVNLTGAQDAKWNAGKTVRDSGAFVLRVRMNRMISRFTLSTPDHDQILVQTLEHRVERTEFGLYAVVEIPAVHIWSTVVVELEGPQPLE